MNTTNSSRYGSMSNILSASARAQQASQGASSQGGSAAHLVRPQGGSAASIQPQGGSMANIQPQGGSMSQVRPAGGSMANIQPQGGSMANIQPQGGSMSQVRPAGGSMANIQPQGGSMGLVVPHRVPTDSFKLAAPSPFRLSSPTPVAAAAQASPPGAPGIIPMDTNRFTNDLFYELHPEMTGKAIDKLNQPDLAKEWLEIRGKIEDSLIRRQLGGGRKDQNGITNELFWNRHPEMRGKKIHPSQKGLAKEWKDIHEHVDKRADELK